MKILFALILFIANNFAHAQDINKEHYNNQLKSPQNMCNNINNNSCSSKFLNIINKQNNPIFDYVFKLQNNYEESYSLYNNTCKKYDSKSPQYMECFQKFRQNLLPIFKSIAALSSSFKNNNNQNTVKNGFLKEYRYYLLDLINLNEQFQLNNAKSNENLKMTTEQLLQDPYVDHLILGILKHQQQQLLNDFNSQEQLKEKVNIFFNSLIEETGDIKNQIGQLRKINNPHGL